MSTNRLYAFEHAPSKVLVRAHQNPGVVQVLREHREIARYRAHPNYQLAFIDGIVAWTDSYGKTRWVDVAANGLPAEPHVGPKNVRGLLDRERAVVLSDPRWPYQAPDGSKPTGLVVVRLADGAVVDVWPLPASEPEVVVLFAGTGQNALPGTKAPIWENVPELVIAHDRETWALLAPKQLMIGRRDATLAHVAWVSEQLYPPKGVFDGERLVVAGAPGVAAISLDGRVVASWAGVLPDAPLDRHGRPRRAAVLSTPLVDGGSILVVVAPPNNNVAHGEPRSLRAVRLDRDTLAFAGDVQELSPLWDDSDQSALLRLADGALAWFPRTAPIRISGGGGRGTDHVIVSGQEPPPLIPAPDAAWYSVEIGERGAVALDDIAGASEGSRWSLARFLLERRLKDPRISELVLVDPRAFAPFADVVVDLDDAPLRAWHDADNRASAWAAWGASDAAVDRLIARLELAASELSELGRTRVALLANVLTGYALARAADLARAHAAVRRLLRDHLIDVGGAGPAEPRYTLDGLDVLAVSSRFGDKERPATPGLTSGRPPAEWTTTPRGRICARPLTEVLGIADGPVFFASGCEECDECITDLYEGTVEDGQLAIEGLNEPTCPGAGSAEGDPVWLALAPRGATKHPVRQAGRIGGRPLWWQAPEPPICRCGRLMQYAGYVAASSLRDDIADLALYAFNCKPCGRFAQVTQMT